VKVRLDIEYDGTKFCGWQRQESYIITVQETIEKAILQAIGNNRQREIILHGAGRTDSGVHAINQVAHFEIDSTSSWNEKNIDRFNRALNFYLLGSGIVVKTSSVATTDFHARFSATHREYLYIISNRPTKSVLLNERTWHIRSPLDVSSMQEAALSFIGHHDFSAFRSADCQAKNHTRTIEDIEVTKRDGLIMLTVLARSFLHNQVRIMTGTLVQIGLHKMPISVIKKLLEEGDRTKSGPTAPPYGLYLKNVLYTHLV
jgi:tRNA pseudouridine38-40 synthase